MNLEYVTKLSLIGYIYYESSMGAYGEITDNAQTELTSRFIISQRMLFWRSFVNGSEYYKNLLEFSYVLMFRVQLGLLLL